MKLNEMSTSQQDMIDAAVSAGFQFIPNEKLEREYSDVFLENILSIKLLEINGDYVENKEAYVNEAITLLRKIIRSCRNCGLINANKEFMSWMLGEHSLPYGKNNTHVPLKFIDFENLENNSYVVSSEVCYPVDRKTHGANAFDVVLYINGIPVVIAEAKTPFEEEWTWQDGACDIYDTYQVNCPECFVPNILCVASDGLTFRYSSICVPPSHWGPWKLNGLRSEGTSKDTMMAAKSLFKPDVLIDIARFFTIYKSNDENGLVKIICRYQQYEGANAIIKRVLTKEDNRGLISHFQGSGKSYLMVFAAQKLRMMKELKNPSIIIVIDRVNLDDQINQDFALSDIPNVKSIEHISDLKKYLESDSRFIFITTIFKFSKMPQNISERSNIIVFADEAHRTQYGLLAGQMHNSLPNASYFGLTGTPIAKKDRNTYKTFGSKLDKGGIMSLYDFRDSIRDGETLPLKFQPVKLNIKIDKESIKEAFDDLTKNLPDGQKDIIAQKASRAGTVLMSPKVANEICAHVSKHYHEFVEPNKMKAMIVAQDRFCCVAYNDMLKRIDPELETAVVIDTGGKGDPLKKWHLSRDEENKILKRYNDPNDPLKILIVTSKLITGFNSKILQTQYLVKYLKEHTLIQCITRVNRTYNDDKKNGLIVDYLGIFDDVKETLSYADVDLDGLIENINGYKKLFPIQFDKTMSYLNNFEHIDSIDVYDAMKTFFDSNKEIRREFAQEALNLQTLWNLISPDTFLAKYQSDYIWLMRAYKYIAPKNNGRALWREFGPKTRQIIADNVTYVSIDDEFEKLVLDANLIEKARNGDPADYIRKVGLGLRKRIKAHQNDPIFQDLDRRLEKLQQAMSEKTQRSIDILQQLLDLSNEYLQEESKIKNDPHAHAVRVLSIFLEQVKTSNTDLDVEETVHELDDFIMGYRYKGWEKRRKAEREVKLQLTEILRKHGVMDESVYNSTMQYFKLCYTWGEVEIM